MQKGNAYWISEATRQLCQKMLDSSWGKSLKPSMVKEIIRNSYERNAEVVMPEIELLVDEAVEKWLNGPEEIDEFCEWLIRRAWTAGGQPEPAKD